MTEAPRTPVLIDRVRRADYYRVVELFGLLGPRYQCDPEDPRTREVFEFYLHDPRKAALAARDGDALVGVLLFEITPVLSPTHLHARADGMAVAPSHRGRGIGHALVREYLRAAAERGATSVMAKASDPRVIAMYRRMPELTERGVYFYYDPHPEYLIDRAVRPTRDGARVGGAS